MFKRSILFMAAMLCALSLSAKAVQITVEPSDATMYQQNGKAVQPVSQGVYSITCSIVDLAFTVKADGYDSESFVVNLKSPKTMEIKLKPNRKHVAVTADPKEAVIYVDGREAGQGQVEFDIHKGESKTIKLMADEYDTYLKRINFSDPSGANNKMTYNVEMVRNTRNVNIHVDSPAKFYVDGVVVSEGQKEASIKLLKEKPVRLNIVADGYLEYSNLVYFDDDIPTNMTSKLEVDEGYVASDPITENANKKFVITVKKGMSREDAIQRMKYFISEQFESLQINDNIAGWYRTAWTQKAFKGYVVRTRVEIKERPDNGDGKLQYNMMVQSQIAYKKDPTDQDYTDWKRILKDYSTILSDIKYQVE